MLYYNRLYNIIIHYVSVPAFTIGTHLLPPHVRARLNKIEEIFNMRGVSHPQEFDKSNGTAICLHRAHSENFKVNGQPQFEFYQFKVFRLPSTTMSNSSFTIPSFQI